MRVDPVGGLTRFRFLLVLTVGMLLMAAPAAAENLLARATIASYPATTGGAEAVGRIRDGNLGTPWTNAPGDRGPYEFVFTWEDPVVFGGLRVAVPGGADTTSSARVLKLEIVPEGDLNWFTLKNVKLEPREGYQIFVLPALPTRKLKLTVVRNHGHPVNTYLSEIELLPPLEAGYRESLPGWVQRAGGPVWLHNGVSDTVGAPRPRESLSDLFGLVTGHQGEVTLILADNPSPFGEGKGVVLQVGAFAALLADRWYDGNPGYEFLLGSGDLTVRALAPGAAAVFQTRDLLVRTDGPATVQITAAPLFGTRVEVKEGTATLTPYPGEGAAAYRLRSGDVGYVSPAPVANPDTVAAGDLPLLDWFGTVSVFTGRGMDLKWSRFGPSGIELTAGDTVLVTLTDRLRSAAAGTGLGGDPAEALARRWTRCRHLADFILAGVIPWLADPVFQAEADLDAARLAAALLRSGIRCGLGTGTDPERGSLAGIDFGAAAVAVAATEEPGGFWFVRDGRRYWPADGRFVVAP